MSKVEVDQVDPQSGTTLTLGTSGDTVSIPSGVTLANSGTATGFPAPTSGIAASAIDSGTIATARLGSGTASSTTFLRGDQTYAEAGGGKILQVVSTTISSQVAIASTSYTDTGITLAITPSATSSKILVMVFIQYTAYSDNNGEIKSNARIVRDSTGVFESVSVLGSQVETASSGYQQTWGTLPLSYLDSPSSISAITYKVTAKNSTTSGNRQLKINHDSLGTSTITLMEVSA